MSSDKPDRWLWEQAFAVIEPMDPLQRKFSRRGERLSRRGAWAPPVDIFETHSELRIEVALPGVELDDVEVLLDGDVLILRGARRLPERYRRARVHRLEIPYGAFERRIRLPEGRYTLVENDLAWGTLVLTLRKTGGTR